MFLKFSNILILWIYSRHFFFPSFDFAFLLSPLSYDFPLWLLWQSWWSSQQAMTLLPSSQLCWTSIFISAGIRQMQAIQKTLPKLQRYSLKQFERKWNTLMLRGGGEGRSHIKKNTTLYTNGGIWLLKVGLTGEQRQTKQTWVYVQKLDWSYH